MSVALEDIWDAPVLPSSPRHRTNGAKFKEAQHSGSNLGDVPLFFESESDNDAPAAAKPGPAASSRRNKPDIDAMFENLDGADDDDILFQPLAPSLDLDALRRAATAKHAEAAAAQSSIVTSGGDVENDHEAQDSRGGAKITGKRKKGVDDSGEGKEKRTLPKMDEERLLGPNGFPRLIKDTKNFTIKGKGHEASDLQRLLQTYQFWTQKMFPKTTFRETVDRVEKLCHSKRMHVALSVWRDEAKGIVKGREGVIDLTSSNEVNSDDGEDDNENNGHIRVKREKTADAESDDHASSRFASAPPSSSEVDDDFDIDAVIREEEERRAASKDTSVAVAEGQTAIQSARVASSNIGFDLDEEAMWAEIDAFEDPFVEPEPQPPLVATRNEDAMLTSQSMPGGDSEDQEMWDIVQEMENVVKENSDQTGDAGVQAEGIAQEEGPSEGNVSRGTNDDEWDEMYF